MASETQSKLEEFESLLGYTFKSPDLLTEALTHPSYQAGQTLVRNNQRLEFLGDSILGAVLSSWLFHRFDNQDEGQLSRKKALLARGKLLGEIGRDLNLEFFLMVAKSEKDAHGRLRISALEDAFEALIGAVFLDGGYDAAEKLISNWESKLLQTISADQHMFNPKGKLQEFVQSELKGTKISYKLVKQSGPSHRRKFMIDLYLGNKKISSGSGMSKKAAEEIAAVEAIKKLDFQLKE